MVGEGLLEVGDFMNDVGGDVEFSGELGSMKAPPFLRDGLQS